MEMVSGVLPVARSPHHDGDVGSSISEEQHDWPIEQAADTPDISLQEMRKPYTYTALFSGRSQMHDLE